MTTRMTAGGRPRSSAAAGGRGRAPGHGAPRRTPPRGRPARPPAKRRPWLSALLKWAFVAGIWVAVILGGAIVWLTHDLPPIDEVGVPHRRPAITVLAADGTQIARYGDLIGAPVSLDQLPPYLPQALLAVEDRRFYMHFGIDPIGLARAALVNYGAGRVVQGGSTITQQLAKILFLTPDRTLRRKVQEALLAIWLELTYSKGEILTAYLNRVYLGAGAYGVDAAARTYFGVPASAVSLRQAAILAGLPKAPSRYSPASSPAMAEARAAVVLDSMVEAGYLTPSERQTLEALPPVPRRRPGSGDGARYFADWVADMVPDYSGAGAGDVIARTTLDPDLQSLAERVVAEHLAREGAAARAGQAALVAMRPDGAILAMVGGRSYQESQFNRAVQAARQPGSAFKPIVYLAALEQGLRPYQPVLDAPINVAGYAPDNYGGGYLGQVTATEALARSANTAAVRVLEMAGIDRAIDVARRLGLTGEMRRDLTLALGSSEVTLLELTAAYAVFARDGHGVWPHALEAVDHRDGSPVYRRYGEGPGEVVMPWHVRELNRMLAAVIEIGTGRAARLDRAAAGKTGTSQDHRDAWFVGFTADLVVGVWVGNDDSTPMNNVTGATLPARIWRDFMIPAHQGLPPRPLPGLDEPVQAPTMVAQPAAPSGGGFGGLLRRLLGAD